MLNKSKKISWPHLPTIIFFINISFIFPLFAATGPLPQNAPIDSWGLTKDQKRRILQITYRFENTEINCVYDFIKDLHDGRGYTAGCVGFNLRSGSIQPIVRCYAKNEPGNILENYIPALDKFTREDEVNEITGIDGFADAWKMAAQDPIFRRCQDDAVDAIFTDAMHEADKLGIRTAVGRAIIYDSLIEHGLGEDDPDSIDPMINKTTRKLRGTPGKGVDEVIWLKNFLEERRKVLAHPNDPTTTDAWKNSAVKRVGVFRTLIEKGNLNLDGPIDLKPFHDAVIP